MTDLIEIPAPAAPRSVKDPIRTMCTVESHCQRQTGDSNPLEQKDEVTTRR